MSANASLKVCECGCEEIVKPGNRFICGHYWRGKKRSDEDRAKMAKGHIGVALSKEHREKISTALTGRPSPMKGRTQSKDARAKISASLTGYTPWNKGVPHSKEHRAKISAAGKGRITSEETKLKMAIASMKPRTDGYCDVWTREYRDDLRKPACEHCGITNMMQLHISDRRLCVHHKNGKKNCAPTDVMTLCNSCHMKLHLKLKREKTEGL